MKQDISTRNLERISNLEIKAKAKSILKNKSPKKTLVADFWVPNIYGIKLWDCVSLMDIAVFRLSKRDKRELVSIRYDFRNGDYLKINSGPNGMATIWDYDIVIILTSYLTESMNLYHQNKGKIPSRIVTIKVCDILKFSQKGCGSRQYDELEMALDRLKNTTIETIRAPKKGDRITRIAKPEGLINGYTVESRTKAGKLSKVSIEIPNWLYKEVTQGPKPHVLTLSPEYFSISSGIDRFIYRLARKSAGTKPAIWGGKVLHERSFSSGGYNTFSQLTRKAIKKNNLPEFDLQKQQGRNGELQLLMQRRK